MNARSCGVGVVKGRFQTPKLHPGQVGVIDKALQNHDQVLLIIGTRYDTTMHDPYPFEMQAMLFDELYPGRLIIIADPATPESYDKRSDELTRLIKSAVGDRPATIYGGPDSIVHTYRGPYPVVAVDTGYHGPRATEIRDAIPYRTSQEYREGYARALTDKKAIPYPAVDVLAIGRSDQKVLMIEKPDGEGKLQFPGVFFDPMVDGSFEDAARRCMDKEIPDAVIDAPWPVGSAKIMDWRYRQTKDSVVSMLYRANYSTGIVYPPKLPSPGEGIKAVHYVEFHAVQGVVAKIHEPIADFMQNRWFH